MVSSSENKPIKLEEMSYHKLSRLIKKLSSIKKKKYKRCKETKYGNINRGFTDAELKKFFQYCKNQKAYLAFFLMANLGLRVGEVVKIKVEDIDFFKRKIRIATEKAHTGDFLYLHEKVRKLLLFWVQKYQDEILKHEGYVLFSSNRLKTDNQPHVSPNWLRREFRHVCYIIDLNEWYAHADDSENLSKPKCANRKLYRLTTHSLRHYYVTHVYKQCKNPVHTQKLARHRAFRSTQVYIHTTNEELDDTMKQVFEEEGIEANDEETSDFVKFYKMWKAMKNE